MKKRAKKKVRTDKCDSKLEKAFLTQWRKLTTIPIAQQVRFHPTRQWRFDFAFPKTGIAIEIQGFGTGHTSYTGMKSDYEKHNHAVMRGWVILYLMSDDLKDTKIRKTILYVEDFVKHQINNPVKVTPYEPPNNIHLPPALRKYRK